MRPVGFVRLGVGVYQHPLVRKSKSGIIIPWLLIKLSEHHGYLPEDGSLLHAPTIAEDLGFIHGVRPFDDIVEFIDGAIERAKDCGLLLIDETNQNLGGRNGAHFATIRGWTSPLYREMAKPPRKGEKAKVNKGKQSLTRLPLPNPRNQKENPAPRARGRSHTPLTNKISDPPGRDLWETK